MLDSSCTTSEAVHMPSHDIPLNLRYMWRSNRSSTETLNVQSILLDSQDPSIGPILLSFCLSFVSFRRADFILTVGVLSVFGSTRAWIQVTEKTCQHLILQALQALLFPETFVDSY